jgi:IS5 family transposase
MKHRAAVEPIIGHRKPEHRLERNRLQGAAGNAVNAVMAAAAINFQRLLRAIPRRCLREIYAVRSRLMSTLASIGSPQSVPLQNDFALQTFLPRVSSRLCYWN